jgi:MFS transporter, DHA1 family, multidrug resistance protein
VTTGGRRRRLTFESWERNVWALALVVFIAFVGFQFFSPFLPLYVMDLGVTDPTRVALWSGMLIAVTPAVSGLLGPLWGSFADRVGRKMMMIRSLAGFVLIVAAMGLVTSVTQLLVLRVLQGVIAGFSVFAMALASVSCPKEKVPVAIGRVQGAQLLSVAIGPAAGGYVASHFGLRYAFFVTAGMCALALVGLIVLFTENRPIGASGPVTATEETGFTLRQVWSSCGFAVVLALLFIGQFIDRGLSLLVPLKVSALPDVTRIAATAGEIISLAAVCATGSALLAGRLAQRWPAERLLLVGLLAGGLPCALMALAGGMADPDGAALSDRALPGRGVDARLLDRRRVGAERASRGGLRLARAERADRHGGQPAGERWPGGPQSARRLPARRRAGLAGRGPAADRGAPSTPRRRALRRSPRRPGLDEAAASL